MISGSSPQTVTLKREKRMNNTTCVFVKRFHLTENEYVTVCNLKGEMVLDIRKFVNNTATIKGLRLNLNQWGTLKQTIHSIDVAVTEPRTYRKHLKGFWMTRLLDSCFNFFYAQEISSVMYTVVKSRCDGSQSGHLSQTNLTCLAMSERELLTLYFEDMINAEDKRTILSRWETAAKELDDITDEDMDMYKRSIFDRWREKMYTMILRFRH